MEPGSCGKQQTMYQRVQNASTVHGEQCEGSTALGQPTQRQKNLHLQRFSSLSKTKLWLTWPVLLKVLLWGFQRPPSANISLHYRACLISFLCPVPHFPPNWKPQGPQLGSIWGISTSFHRWSRQNVLWFKALCKEGFRHKSKDASKRTPKSKPFGNKQTKKIQANR